MIQPLPSAYLRAYPRIVPALRPCAPLAALDGTGEPQRPNGSPDGLAGRYVALLDLARQRPEVHPVAFW